MEWGDLVQAETVDWMVGARLGTARVSCPYRAKRVGRLAGAATLVRSHSHTITALGRDQSWSKHVGRFAPGRYRGFRSSDGYLLVSVPWNLAKGRLRLAVLPFP